MNFFSGVEKWEDESELELLICFPFFERLHNSYNEASSNKGTKWHNTWKHFILPRVLISVQLFRSLYNGEGGRNGEECWKHYSVGGLISDYDMI